MKGQPLAYNKDNQEDKEPLFDTVDTLTDTLAHLGRAWCGGITVKAEAHARARRCRATPPPPTWPTTWCKKGLPFRDAHEAVAHAVRNCVDRRCDLSDMTLEEMRAFSPLIEADIFEVLTLEGSVAARNHIGGTAPQQVRAAIARNRARLA